MRSPFRGMDPYLEARWSNVHVLMMRQVYVDGGRRFGVADYASTNDAGQYRMVSVAPGTYLVMASLSQTWTVIERDVEQAIGYVISADMSVPLAECIAALPEEHWKPDQQARRRSASTVGPRREVRPPRLRFR